MEKFIEKAFEIGHEICEADGGYLFRVYLKSGREFHGVPELPDGDSVLIMNNDAEIIRVIPCDAIESIDVEQV